MRWPLTPRGSQLTCSILSLKLHWLSNYATYEYRNDTRPPGFNHRCKAKGILRCLDRRILHKNIRGNHSLDFNRLRYPGRWAGGSESLRCRHRGHNSKGLSIRLQQLGSPSLIVDNRPLTVIDSLRSFSAHGGAWRTIIQLLAEL